MPDKGQAGSGGDEGWILTSDEEFVEIASGGLGSFHLPNPYGYVPPRLLLYK